MRFAVTLLRHKGVRLSREAIQVEPAHCGELLIGDFVRGNAEGRSLLMAELKCMGGTFPRDLVSPLFEPHVIRMRRNWFILNGWQIEVDAGRQRVEYRQEWLVRESTAALEALQEARLNEQAAQCKRMGIS